jgi:hypothetical protein
MIQFALDNANFKFVPKMIVNLKQTYQRNKILLFVFVFSEFGKSLDKAFNHSKNYPHR